MIYRCTCLSILVLFLDIFDSVELFFHFLCQIQTWKMKYSREEKLMVQELMHSAYCDNYLFFQFIHVLKRKKV